MNKLLILFIIPLLFSCQEDDEVQIETDVIGEWEIVARYADPGDGSGSFQPTTGKFLTFSNNNVLFCNQGFCFASLTQATTTGSFDDSNKTITTSDCDATYSFNGMFLEVSYLCIEPCIERYIRVN
ncbi:hypothetical protein AAT17_11135 [Nonlabens sp. MIC269]|uniref:hypothetical protein n=1 Tax=Nonlabens TaxID=363408 RepID=UPI000720AED6|nr:hypothetical protein [Nonlabens sp. MIC269]ALM21747.1 hypothetical protein AAT17_11135 [Nonlabens sp. MIC269]MEE2800644.1 hypothetical protein [Bacteroidota bacterium]